MPTRRRRVARLAAAAVTLSVRLTAARAVGARRPSCRRLSGPSDSLSPLYLRAAEVSGPWPGGAGAKQPTHYGSGGPMCCGRWVPALESITRRPEWTLNSPKPSCDSAIIRSSAPFEAQGVIRISPSLDARLGPARPPSTVRPGPRTRMWCGTRRRSTAPLRPPGGDQTL